MERRALVKKLMALAAVPVVAKAFPAGTALAEALASPAAASSSSSSSGGGSSNSSSSSSNSSSSSDSGD